METILNVNFFLPKKYNHCTNYFLPSKLMSEIQFLNIDTNLQYNQNFILINGFLIIVITTQN